jgi:hypothetical protein
MIKQLDKFHTTKLGLLIFALVEAALVVAFFGLSVDRGNFLWYLLTLVFLFGSFHNAFRLIGIVVKRKS